MLKPDASKRCTYCEGPICIYGGQLEHELARKLETSDVEPEPNKTSGYSVGRLYPSA